MRPQSEIENDVKKALSVIPEIEGITHIYCHYLNQELTVQVNILLDVEMRIRDAQKIASAARMKIEQIKDIDAADLHLELDDAFSVKAFLPKRSSVLPDLSSFKAPLTGYSPFRVEPFHTKMFCFMDQRYEHQPVGEWEAQGMSSYTCKLRTILSYLRVSISPK